MYHPKNSCADKTVAMVITFLALLTSHAVGLLAPNVCPSSTTSVNLFTASLDFTSCPSLFECMTTYCSCVGGAIEPSSGECGSYFASASTVEACAMSRVVCTLKAAVAAGSQYDDSSCATTTQALRDEYVAWYYQESNSNLTSACGYEMCELLSSKNPGVQFDMAGICNVDRTAVGVYGTPQSKTCAYASRRVLTSDLPARDGCPGIVPCEVAMRGCVDVSADYTQISSSLSITAYEVCFKTFTQCLVLAATNVTARITTGLQTDYPPSCSGWAGLVVELYSDHYSSSNQVASTLSGICQSALCNVEVFNEKAPKNQNLRMTCLFQANGRPMSAIMPIGKYPAGLPTCTSTVTEGIMTFADPRPLPLTCPALGVCEENLCTCIHSIMALTGECTLNIQQFSDLTTAQNCLLQYFICTANAASDAGMMSGRNNGCNTWAYSFTNTFSQFYYGVSPVGSAFVTNILAVGCSYLNYYNGLMLSTESRGLRELRAAVTPQTCAENIAMSFTKDSVKRPGRCPVVPTVLQSEFCEVFTGQSYFYENIPNVQECPPISVCDAAFANCSGTSLVNGNAIVFFDGNSDLVTFATCYPAYLTCLTRVANDLAVQVASNTLPASLVECSNWAMNVSMDYRLYYASDNATRLMASYLQTCNNYMCVLFVTITDETDYSDHFGDTCSQMAAAVGVPPPLEGGASQNSGEGIPSLSQCPSGSHRYFANLPFDVCGRTSAIGSCERTWCSCINSTYNASTGCKSDLGSIPVALFEQCGPQMLRCVVNASAQEAPSQLTPASGACETWKYTVANDYLVYYFTSNKSQTALLTECADLICNVEAYEYNRTANTAALCNFDGLANESSNGNSDGCMNISNNLFDKLPQSSCPTLTACLRTFCNCAGGTLNETDGDCKMSVAPAVDVAKQCLTTGLTCLVRAGLAVYVPGTDAGATSDVCLAWSVPVARSYAALYTAGTNAAARAATELYKSCNVTACKTLSSLGVTDFASVCAFSGLTTFPTYQPPTPAFYCPDNTTAANIGQCRCTADAVIGGVNATFETAFVSGQFTLGARIYATGYASYGISDTSKNCSGYDFSRFLKFQWELRVSSTTQLVSVSQGSTISVQPTVLRAGVGYSLTLSATGLINGTVPVAQTWNFMTVAPAPTVSITWLGSSLRVSNSNATAISAKVLDNFPPETPTYSWTCVSQTKGTECPVLTSSTVHTATIPADSVTGAFVITYTYEGVSSSLSVTIVAGAIPIVRVIQISSPLIASPIVYLSTQRVLLGSSVTYPGSKNLTYLWTAGFGFEVGKGRQLTLEPGSLFVSSFSSLQAGGNPSANTVLLRVSLTSDPTVYGESTFTVYAVTPINLGLTVAKQGDVLATSATALSDTLLLTPSSNMVSAPYGLGYTYVFGYSTSSGAKPLSTTPLGSGFTASAPFVSGGGTVTFTVTLRMGGMDAAMASQTFGITLPSSAAAASSITSSASGISNANDAAFVAGNFASVVSGVTDSDTLKQMASAVTQMLANVASTLSTLPPASQKAAFETLTLALSAADATNRDVMQNQTLTVLDSTVGTGSVDPSLVSSLVGLVATLDVKKSADFAYVLASSAMNNPDLQIGTVVEITSGGLTIGGVKLSGDNVAGTTMSTGGITLSLGIGFTFNGVGGNSVVGVSSAVFASNPFADGPSTVVSYEVQVDSSPYTVSNLAKPLVFVMPSQTGVCSYWDTTALAWSTNGLTTTYLDDGSIQCSSNHATAFGASPSSAAGAMLSLIAVVTMLAIQLFVG